jgi:phospholipid transport system transporter-binding protein
MKSLPEAGFAAGEGGLARVSGALHFLTVGRLLNEGEEAISAGRAQRIDLGGVTASDSSGLALLIEWLSFARAAKQPLKYENIPQQISELAHLSDVEELLSEG